MCLNYTLKYIYLEQKSLYKSWYKKIQKSYCHLQDRKLLNETTSLVKSTVYSNYTIKNFSSFSSLSTAWSVSMISVLQLFYIKIFKNVQVNFTIEKLL